MTHFLNRSHIIKTSDPLCCSVWKEDSGKYYTWRSFGPADQRTQDLWVDMSDVRHAHVRVHGILSNSYKQAAVSLSKRKNAFAFLFLFFMLGFARPFSIKWVTLCYGGYRSVVENLITCSSCIGWNVSKSQTAARNLKF